MTLEIRPGLVHVENSLPTPPPSATTTAFASSVRLVHTCAGDSDEVEEGELVEYCSCTKKPRWQVRWAASGYTPRDDQTGPAHKDPEPVRKEPAQRTQAPLSTRTDSPIRTRTDSRSRSRTRPEPITVTSPELGAPARALRDRRLRDLAIVYETGAKSRKRSRTSREPAEAGLRLSVDSRPGTPDWRVKPGSVKDQMETPMAKVEVQRGAERGTCVDVPRAVVERPASSRALNASAGSQPHSPPTPPLFGDSQPSPTKPSFNFQDLASLPHTGQAPDPYLAARVEFLRLVAEKIGLTPQVVVAPALSRPVSAPCATGETRPRTADPRLKRTEDGDLGTGLAKRRRVEAPISEDTAPSRQVPTGTVNPRLPKARESVGCSIPKFLPKLLGPGKSHYMLEEYGQSWRW